MASFPLDVVGIILQFVDHDASALRTYASVSTIFRQGTMVACRTLALSKSHPRIDDLCQYLADRPRLEAVDLAATSLTWQQLIQVS